MNIFANNYTKLIDSYNKIINCIDSSETLDHLIVISNMTDNWKDMIELWHNQILTDRSDKRRRNNSIHFAETAKSMWDDVSDKFHKMNDNLVDMPYNYIKPPTKIKTLTEYCDGNTE